MQDLFLPPKHSISVVAINLALLLWSLVDVGHGMGCTILLGPLESPIQYTTTLLRQCKYWMALCTVSGRFSLKAQRMNNTYQYACVQAQQFLCRVVGNAIKPHKII